MPLSQVIANDRAYKLKQDTQREEQRDVSEFVPSLLPFGSKRQNKELSSSNSSLSSTSETPNESTSPNTPEPAPRARRRVSFLSVDLHELQAFMGLSQALPFLQKLKSQSWSSIVKLKSALIQSIVVAILMVISHSQLFVGENEMVTSLLPTPQGTQGFFGNFPFPQSDSGWSFSNY